MDYYLVQGNKVSFGPSGIGGLAAQLEIKANKICLRCREFPDPDNSLKRLKEYFGGDLFSNPDKCKIHLKLSSPTDDPSKLHVRITGAALKLLDVYFGPKLSLSLEICNAMLYLPCGTPSGPLQSFRTTNMKIERGTLANTVSKDIIAFPEEWKMSWKKFQGNGGKICGNVNLLVSANSESLWSRIKSDSEFAAYCKKLLRKELRDRDNDVQIICGNDKIGCQQDILIAQSEVFKRMLLVDQTKEIKMDGMTSKGLRAFIWYLYSRDLRKAGESCGIALELMFVGHKYMVSQLENDVKEIFMDKITCWFDVDSTLALFMFARGLEIHKDLKERAIQVLKEKRREVGGSAVLAQLFHRYPTAALELFRAFLLV